MLFYYETRLFIAELVIISIFTFLVVEPLLTYILDKNNYKSKMEKVKKQLETSIPEINKLFKDYDFNILIGDLEKYSKNVEKHYKEYLKTNEIWNRLKEENL